ncbi:MAG: hypothetical protein WD669_04270 [Pirellulales bacterium]
MKIVSVIGLAMLTVFSVAAVSDDAERSIPLSSIITSSPQPDVQAFEVAFPNQEERLKISQQIGAFSSGASNLFLVDAIKPLNVVRATISVLQGSHSGNSPAPVNTADPEQGSHWLVVYLGVGPSQPVWWTVESVTVTQNTIRVNYHSADARMVTRDVWRYYYWAPLGKLDAGAYQLELYDTKDKAVTLLRRVKV